MDKNDLKKSKNYRVLLNEFEIKNYTEAIFAGIDHSIKSQFDGYLNLQAFHKYLFTTEKINYIKTSITLSNLGVLNIYNKLNYSFYNVKEDYHFFYEK